MIKKELITFNFGIFDVNEKSIFVDKVVNFMREEKCHFILNFYSTNEPSSWRHIFNFGHETQKPFIGISDIYADNFSSLDFDKLKETTEKFDFLYDEDFNIIIMSSRALEYLNEKYKKLNIHKKGVDQPEIERPQDIFFELQKSNFIIDTISLGE